MGEIGLARIGSGDMLWQMQEIEETFAKGMGNGLEGRLRSYTLNPLEKTEVDVPTARSAASDMTHKTTKCIGCGVELQPIDQLFTFFHSGKEFRAGPLCKVCYRNGGVSL